MRITEHLQKRHKIFLVPVWRLQYFRHILQNPNLKQMASCPNNHYWAYTFLNPWALKQTATSSWFLVIPMLGATCNEVFETAVREPVVSLAVNWSGGSGSRLKNKGPLGIKYIIELEKNRFDLLWLHHTSQHQYITSSRPFSSSC